MICWAVLALFDPAADRPILVRLSIASLHLFAGILILIRSPVRQQGALKLVAMAAPAVLLGGWAFYFANSWRLWAQLILLLGTAITIASLASLGKNFSVLPAKRSIVSSGTYNIVRHPIYTGELIMLLACAFSSTFPIGLIVYVCTVLLVMLRINAEEQLLHSDNAYRKYTERVRSRLLPYLW